MAGKKTLGLLVDERSEGLTSIYLKLPYSMGGLMRLSLLVYQPLSNEIEEHS